MATLILTRLCSRNVLIYARQQKHLTAALSTLTGGASNGYGNRSLLQQNSKWPPKVQCPQSAYQQAIPVIGSQCRFSKSGSPCNAGKSDAKSSAALAESDIFGEASKLGLFAKFKLMYKKYWYVLIPVHIVTSVGWFGGFYYLSKSGVDVPALLDHLHVSQTIIGKIQHTDMGHLAIAYLCYKVFTPLRYAVTLGGTTVSIKYLVQTGHIKPMPSKTDIMKMYEDKKAHRAQIKADKEAEKAKQNHS